MNIDFSTEFNKFVLVGFPTGALAFVALNFPQVVHDCTFVKVPSRVGTFEAPLRRYLRRSTTFEGTFEVCFRDTFEGTFEGTFVRRSL